MKKRILSVLLCFCMVVGMLPTITPAARAAGTGVIDRLDQLRNTYKQGWYWHKDVVDGTRNIVTEEPCKHNLTYQGSDGEWYYTYSYTRVCGNYGGVYQCWGFAYLIFDEIFGSNAGKIRGNNYNDLRPGDYVRFGTDNDGHSCIVLEKNGNMIKVVECNAGYGDYSGPCRIGWTHEYDVSKGCLRGNDSYYPFGYYYRASNYDEVNGTPSQPTYAATTLKNGNFYARIFNSQSSCYVGRQDNNVVLVAGDRYDPRQIWQFIYYSDIGAYKIVNMYDGRCLDATNWGACNGANITVGADNGTEPERWWLCGSQSTIGYTQPFYFVPSHLPNQEFAMDVVNGTKEVQPPGTNIQLYENGYRSSGKFVASQDFRIADDVVYSTPAKPATPTFRSISANPASTTISWNAVPEISNYDSREYKIYLYSKTTKQYIIVQNMYGTSYTASLPAGDYWVQIQAVNTKYPNYVSGLSYREFTVYPYCTVTLTASPVEGGTVWNGGLYCEGEYATLQAKPNDGWVFKGWTRNGQPVTDWNGDGSSVVSYGLTITGDETFQALFERVAQPTPTYAINVNSTTGGSVSGGGIYVQGSSVTVTATAHEGYQFKGWQENGIIIEGAAATYMFEANTARNLTAVFEAKPLPRYTVTVTASPSDGGTVIGGGDSIEQGSSVTVTATANDGYAFKYWTEGGSAVSSEADYSFTVGANRTLVAVFESNLTPEPIKYTVTVSASPDAGGTVTGGGSYTKDTSVTVTAVPNSGYQFKRWTQNGAQVSTNTSYIISSLSVNQTLVAVFEKEPDPVPVYTVTVNTSAGGTVAGGGSCQAGASMIVTATPASGYQFKCWMESGSEVSTSSTYALSNISTNHILTAVFEKIDTKPTTYTVSLGATVGSNSITGAGNYSANTEVTVHAVADTGYRFVEWQEDDETVSVNPSYQFIITKDRTLRAIFEKDAPVHAIRYDVTVNASDEGGMVDGGGTFNEGQEITVTAVPKDGYNFLYWTANGNTVSTNEAYTFTVRESLTLTAVFEKSGKRYTILASASPISSGTISGGGSLLENTSATLTATANSGYQFVRWTEDGVEVDTSASYTFTVTKDRTLVAEFTTTGGSPSNPGNTPSSPGNSSTPSTNSWYPSTQTLPVKTENVTNAGVKVTETIASPNISAINGKAAVTISSAICNEIVKQAVANNSQEVIIMPKITGNVTKAEVSIPASTVGEIQRKTNATIIVSTPVADVTIPNGGLDSLSGTGGMVTVTTEQVDHTIELSITAGGRSVASVSVDLTLTVPMSYTAPGTVAVLIHESGTREVMRKSAAANGTVTIPLNGSAKLEIVDNSKYFVDVPTTSWAVDAVAFASSHELFNGTGANQFSPDLPMTRGMLATVLHNSESNPYQPITDIFSDVNNSAWYAEGVAWAAAKGIMAGYGSGQFGPDDNITREQLAVILWRYAGSPAATSKKLHFTDVDQASDWALEALCWAVGNSVLNGKGNGVLDPRGQATRAQVAQMLMNYLIK